MYCTIRLSRYFLPGIALLVIATSTCGGVELRTHANLDFYVATKSVDDCSQCRPVSYEDQNGFARTFYVRENPDLVIHGSEIVDMQASQVVGRTAVVTIIFNEIAVSKLERLSESNLDGGDMIVVAIKDLILGNFFRQHFRDSHGVFVFAFKSRDRLDSVMDALGIGVLASVRASEDEMVAACLSAVGDDAELRRECERHFERDRDAEARSLERVERLLEAPHPDYKKAAEELGVDLSPP